MSVSQRVDSTEPHPESGSPGRRTPAQSVWKGIVALSVGTAFSAALVFWLVGASLIDDAYITLTYAKTLATHFQWGMIPGEQANSATSPLNVITLGTVTWLLRPIMGPDAVAALAVTFVAANVGTALALRGVSRSLGLPTIAGIIGTALLLVNPLLLSTVGLEMTLAAFILSWVLWCAVRGKAIVFGVAAGFLVLTRIDLAVFAVVLVLGVRALRHQWWKTSVAVVVVAPWFVYSWLMLGSAVPDTLLIKQLQDYWGELTFGNGLAMYVTRYPLATIWSLAAPVLALPVLVMWWVHCVVRPHATASVARAPVLLGVGGVIHYAAYVMLGVPPYHWYYAPSVIALTLALVFVFPAVVARAWPALLLCGMLVVGQVGFVLSQGFPWREAAVTTNGATASQYARMGVELGNRVGTATVSSPGEIGTLAYYCDCAIVDEFSDRGYLREKVEQRRAELGPFGRWLLDLNYRHFDFGQQPRPIKFDLRRVDGFGSHPVWNGDSAYHQPAHFVLEQR